MRHVGFYAAAAILSATLPCGVSLGQAAGTPGSKIEVREGDTWATVTVLRKEGRRTQIRYEDGTEEWVTADRMRTPGATPPAQATPPGQAAAQARSGTPERRPAKASFAPGDAIQFKSWNRWNDGTFERMLRGWYQVTAKDKATYWLEPWAVRIAGSAYDVEGWGTGRGPSMKGESAPTSPPPATPKSNGADQFMIPGADGTITPAGPFTPIDREGALDPKPSTGKPLTLPPSKPAPEFISCTIRYQYNAMHSIVRCYDTPGTALMVLGLFMDQPAEVVRLDVNALRQLDKRLLDAPRFCPTGAADGGNTILAVPAGFFPKTLHLLKLEGGQYKLKANFKPFTNDFPHVIQAALLNPTRAVVVSSGGDGWILDLEAAKAVGFVRVKPGTSFFIHPSGQLIGCLTAANTALLLRPDDFSTIAEFRDIAGRGNLTVDPTGTYVAFIASDNTIRTLKIEDGSTVGSIQVKSDFAGLIELLSPESMFVEHHVTPLQPRPTLYDVKQGMPAWVYDAPPNTRHAVLPNGQLLYTALEGDLAAACIATIPDATARKALKAASKDSFLVAPGTAVQIEGDFAAFGTEAARAKQIVQTAVKAAGLVVANQAPIHLVITAEAGPTEKRDVQVDAWNRTPILQSVVGPSSIVTVALVHQGTEVWSQEFRYQLGGMVKLQQGETLEGAALEAARITADGLSRLTLPSYLPRGTAPGAPAALGTSELTVRGFNQVVKPPQAPPAAPRQRMPLPLPSPRRVPTGPQA